MITAAQIRAARALLGWSGAELANGSGVSLQTIRRMESAIGPGRSSAANVEAIVQALVGAGIVFIDADEPSTGGPGVRLKS